MSDTQPTPAILWTRERAALLATVCLLAGIGGGWLIHGPQVQTVAGANTASSSTPSVKSDSMAAPKPDPDRSKQMADAQAAPLLERLKSNPDNAELLTSLGNLYYDAQQYSVAVGYYGRSLKGKPSDAAVRTDMGTAYWYMGNADRAISELNKALTYAPNNSNTLFNLGLVKWRGKSDGAGALADWKKLLATNPNYQGKDKVEQMMTEVTQREAAKAAN